MNTDFGSPEIGQYADSTNRRINGLRTFTLIPGIRAPKKSIGEPGEPDQLDDCDEAWQAQSDQGRHRSGELCSGQAEAQHSCKGRASVSYDEGHLQSSLGLLPRTGQEHGAVVHAVRSGRIWCAHARILWLSLPEVRLAHKQRPKKIGFAHDMQVPRSRTSAKPAESEDDLGSIGLSRGNLHRSALP